MIRRALALLTLTFALSGCTYFGSYFVVEELNKAQPKGPAFSQALTQHYKDRANYSQNVTYHYEQAYRNAERGLMAADGAPVSPYDVNAFAVPSTMEQEILKARADLDKALNNGGRERAPRESALAQAKFDCWVEDSEKTWLPELYKTCRAEFFDAMQQITAMKGEPVDLSNTNWSATSAPIDINANRFLIFFGQSGATLTKTTAQSLDQIAQIIKDRQPRAIRIDGFSDSNGSKKSKKSLSQKRAIAVAEALINRGVDKNIITTRAMSDKTPLVKTKSKNVPANRRAEIWLDF